jgi:hypothetical protein
LGEDEAAENKNNMKIFRVGGKKEEAENENNL